MQRMCEMIIPLMKTDTYNQWCRYHILNVQILQLLLNEGYIRGYSIHGDRINILLKHYKGSPVIRNIRVISKPSRDIWVTPHELKSRTKFNTGLWIIQTPIGIISHRDCINMGIGGKMLIAINNQFQHFC
ncbi:30S ribosomal protein S8, putative [Theileria annulata]|uniref:30S ribosomal protein S8, putative n=1 Tax=Theileria annulata TaxID=5874 RepID=Q4UJ49_THEAN|nr:30S ribosomal protein S8, putative [Theileria annulata]CAI72890.1 30S ribosomal protein S8, putative [Theileria annulata]|eukprot:XP_953568.1 30S ribosomal protein S8, putative [Theileria annulata]